MPPLPCDRTTSPPTCRASPTCSQCRIAAKHQEMTRLVITKRVVENVLDAHKAEKEAYKSAIETKISEIAAYKAANEKLRNAANKLPPK
jgi:hypothetical protein